MSWYALLERVYKPLDVYIESNGAPRTAPNWDTVLEAAATYFQLEQLSLLAESPGADAADHTFEIPLYRHPAVGTVAPRYLARGPSRCQTDGPPSLLLRARSRPGTVAKAPVQKQLRIFAGHLEHCLQLQHRLELEYSALDRVRSCLDRLPDAMALCGGDGRVCFVNRAGRELQRQFPALQLDKGGCHFRAGDGTDPLEKLFSRLHRRANTRCTPHLQTYSDGFVFSLIQLEREPTAADAVGFEFGLLVQPPPAWSTGPKKGMPEPTPAPASLIRRLQERYGLTEAEALVAHALAVGISIHRHAALRKRSAQTLRKQTKSAFAKLGVHSQKDLILRVWQERQADWVECIKLLVDGDESRANPSPLAYPRLCEETVDRQVHVPIPGLAPRRAKPTEAHHQGEGPA